jgi:Legume lectin domain/RTX calcium-binding nonapeptide repeat (4 copies)
MNNLSTSKGNGQVSVTVDGFGSFGDDLEFLSGDGYGNNKNVVSAQFDPIDDRPLTDVVGFSLVKLNAQSLLSKVFTEGVIGKAETNPQIIQKTPTSLTSSFSYGGLNFLLTQELVDRSVGGVRQGGDLIQTYQITNTTQAEFEFELLRAVDGNLRFGVLSPQEEIAGQILADGQEMLFFASGAEGNPLFDRGFVGITATGGTVLPDSHFRVDTADIILNEIRGNSVVDQPFIDNSVAEDSDDADKIADLPYNAAAILKNNFKIAAGGTGTYVTQTRFGALQVVSPTGTIDRYANSISKATPIGLLGSLQQLQDGLGGVDANDFVKFEIGVLSQLDITAQNSGTTPIALELLDINGRSIKSQFVNTGTQQISFKALAAGSYYLRTSKYQPTSSKYQLDLATTATPRPLVIQGFAPQVGSNQGIVTVDIGGQNFTNNTRILLVGGDGKEISPTKVERLSDGELLATFNLVGVNIGEYAIQAIDGSDMDVAATKLRVTDRPATPPTYSFSASSGVRPNRHGYAYLTVSNESQIDIEPSSLLISAEGALLFLVNNSDKNGKASLNFSVKKLAPGRSESFLVPFRPTLDKPSIEFRLNGVLVGQTRIGNSYDPNDLIGAKGVGEKYWMPVAAILPYTINFENLATATAPATQVIISSQLDPNLDWDTLELGNLGFGSTVIDIPTGLQSYAERLDLRSTLGSYVDISGKLDAQTGQLTWLIQSIDPTTGELVSGINEGFLPPNNTKGDGQGFVTYRAKPKSDIPSGTTITAKARIVFDTNEPIDTPIWSNSIDRSAPTSNLQPLAATTLGRKIDVVWNGKDDGSGVASYNIYVATNGGTPTLWLQNTPLPGAVYSGEIGKTYSFTSVATDALGQVQTNSSELVTTTLQNLAAPVKFQKIGVPDNSLQLFGTVVGTTEKLNLTTDQNYQAGAAFFKTKYQLGANTYFSSRFQMKLNGEQGIDGADGLAFVVRDPNAPMTFADGGYLGYQLDKIGTPYRSVAVEFDTYQNYDWHLAPGYLDKDGHWDDPNGNHIGILSNGSTSNHLAVATPNFNLEDGKLRNVWVEYDGKSQQLDVYMDEGSFRPSSAFLSYKIDLAGTVGAEAIFGFTGATGALRSNVEIFNWDMTVGNRLEGTIGNDLLTVTRQDRLFGLGGDDQLDARTGSGNNQLDGGDGNDTLYGFQSDRLDGGSGDDVLHGGNGDNLLTGGAGRDRFYIVDGVVPTGSNWVNDFNIGEDRLVIEDAPFIDAGSLSITQQGSNALISSNGKLLATLANVDSTKLSTGDFDFLGQQNTENVQLQASLTISQESFELGATENLATFRVTASGNAGLSKIDLFTEGSDGLVKRVGTMTREGGTDVFSTQLAIDTQAERTEAYFAAIPGTTLQTNRREVEVYQPISAAEFERVATFNRELNGSLATDVAAGASSEEITVKVLAFLQANTALIDGDSINVSENFLTWRSKEGVTVGFSANLAAGLNVRGGSSTPVNESSTSSSNNSGSIGVDCNKALVLSPYAYQFGSNDEGSKIAELLKNSGFDVTFKSDNQVSVEDFKHLEKYRAIAIMTHGDDTTIDMSERDDFLYIANNLDRLVFENKVIQESAGELVQELPPSPENIKPDFLNQQEANTIALEMQSELQKIKQLSIQMSSIIEKSADSLKSLVKNVRAGENADVAVLRGVLNSLKDADPISIQIKDRYSKILQSGNKIYDGSKTEILIKLQENSERIESLLSSFQATLSSSTEALATSANNLRGLIKTVAPGESKPFEPRLVKIPVPTEETIRNIPSDYSRGLVVFDTGESVTIEQSLNYNADIKSGRISIFANKPGGTYAISPSFITKYTQDNMPESIVYLGACRGIRDLSMANAFLQQGASSFAGYSDYVAYNDAYDKGVDVFKKLVNGESVGTIPNSYFTLDYFKGQRYSKELSEEKESTYSLRFENGRIFDLNYERSTAGKVFNYTEEQFKNLDVETRYTLATQYFRYQSYGDRSARLLDIVNGGFEASNLCCWKGTGSFEAIESLGSIKAVEGKKMVKISTGAGAIDNTSSSLSQTLFVAPNVKELTVQYNVVSEEPTEFERRNFNDQFTISINNTVKVTESVDGSKWDAVAGLDFPGGDNTVYQTGFRSATIDLSGYRGQNINIGFNVVDNGDAIYDTVALIDGVKLSFLS